jgi:hypothetical protein
VTGCAWLALAGVLRVVRLRFLLRGALPLAPGYALVQAYNLVTSTVPPGAGELAAAWMFRRAASVEFKDALQALLVGRVLDVLLLLTMLLAALAAGVPLPGAAPGSLALPAAALLAAILVPALIHLRAPARVPRLLDHLRGAVGDTSPPRRALVHALDVAAAGARSLPTFRAAVPLLLLTTGTQLLAAAALWSFLPGAGVTLGYVASVVAQVLFLLLRLLPVQGIAGVGTNAAWWALALSWLGEPSESAIAAGAVLYVVFYAAIALLALTAAPLLWLGRGGVAEPGTAALEARDDP